MNRMMIVPVAVLSLLAAAPLTRPAATGANVAVAELGVATGLALVEVVSVKDTDNTPADGNRFDTVTLKVVKSGGAVKNTLMITTLFGGRRVGDVPVLKGPLHPDPFKAGQRYWVVFGPVDAVNSPEGVVAVWAEKDAPVAALERAIAENKFKAGR